MEVENVEELDTPPEVGKAYFVPCVFGTHYNIGPHVLPQRWWPVMRPSHEDSKYIVLYRTVWKDVGGGDLVAFEEQYRESDPGTPHHYHVDARFSPAEWYTQYERDAESWHNVVDIQGPVEWREMVCVREMPRQRLFTGFGEDFVEDHRGKSIKCGRCPHKGIILSSAPAEEGVITCPGHGLQFDAATGKCITRWRGESQEE